MLSIFWNHQRRNFLILAVLLMTIATVHRFSNEFSRLLFEQGPTGAIDLKFRHADVHRWFSGLPVYADKDAIYPPASYVLLWPLLGWLSVSSARWFWAITTIAALAWLIYLLVKESKAETRLELLFVALLAPSMYATSATIGNGQLIVHLLPCLLAAILFMEKHSSTWWRDAAVAGLFVAAMIKPAISLPFAWLLLIRSRNLRPAMLTIGLYIGITLFAVSFQSSGAQTLISDWIARGSAAALRGGYANLHSWLSSLGVSQWILPASMMVFFALGAWIYAHRNVELWLPLGITALVSRLWIYHRLYDDLLVIVPMLTLFRLTKQPEHQSAAAAVFTILWIAALAPARLLSYPAPWNLLFEAGQTFAWLLTFVYLLYVAQTVRKLQLAGSPK